MVSSNFKMRWTVRVGLAALAAGIVVLVFYFTVDGRYADISQLSPKKRYMTVDYHNEGRIGHLMFHFASLVGIATTNNFTPVMFPEPPFELHTLFHVPMLYLRYQDRGLLKTNEFYENQQTIYDNRTENLKSLFPGNVAISGLFQSWKYFKNVQTDLRKRFTFLPHVNRAVKDFFVNAVPRHWWKYPRVGIHIQRKSILSEEQSNWGYSAAPVDYYDRAIKFFRKKLGRHILFVVVTDDIAWAKEFVKPIHVVYSEGNTEHIDFAILSFMHHSIMSSGTFGWWSSWLANGTTVYYKDSVKQLSAINEDFKIDDHFPPTWVAM